jgi:hypothetical protein
LQVVFTKEFVAHAESLAYVKKFLKYYSRKNSKNMPEFRNVGLIIFIAASVCGCASFINSDSQIISFSTKCEEIDYPSYCTVKTGTKIFSLETPAKISLPRTTESLVIICESSISGSYGVITSPFLSPAFIGNVGLGGLAGATIDIVNNRAWAYPSSIDIKIPWCSLIKK